MPHRFLRHRAVIAVDTAQRTVEASATQVQRIVVHAGALADRLEALPQPCDLQQRHQRRDRVDRLRAAVSAGEAALQLRPVDHDADRRSGTGT